MDVLCLPASLFPVTAVEKDACLRWENLLRENVFLESSAPDSGIQNLLSFVFVCFVF